jgi:hypothetical protein
MWQKLSNAFLTHTADSYDLCKAIVNETYNALEANQTAAGINVIRTFFLPFRTAYNNAYGVWETQRKMIQTSHTQDFETAFATYAPKMRLWKEDLNVLLRSEPLYLSQLFPSGRITLYTDGPQQARIGALQNFKTILDPIPIDALEPIKAEVTALLDLIVSKHIIKNRQLENTEAATSTLELQRIAACTALYRVQAKLMDLYAETPVEVERFIPVDLLSRASQTRYVYNHLSAGLAKLIMTRSLADDAEIVLKNTGAASLRFYRSEQSNNPNHPEGITVMAGHEVAVAASALGIGRYYHVQNPGDQVGGYMFEIK